MEYYIFKEHYLARSKEMCKYEWLENGMWIEDKRRTLALNDALFDYGDYSIFDQDHIPEEIAEELIQNGTTALVGNIGYGTTYSQPKIIKLSNWEKPKF